jgi:hypothetical protein
MRLILVAVAAWIAGLVFGAGFVTVYKDRPLQKSATDFA